MEKTTPEGAPLATRKKEDAVKRILAATDFSGRSEHAIQRGCLLAKRLGVPLCIVHVVDNDQPALRVEAEKGAALVLLEEQVKAVRSQTGIDVDACVAEGPAFEGIVRKGNAIEAGVTVIGPHRRQLLHDVFIGTTAERTIRAASRPILMANVMPSREYEKVLVPVDMSDCSAEALAVLKRLPLGKGANISALHVVDCSVTYGRTGAHMSQEEVQQCLSDLEAEARARLSAFLSQCDFQPGETLIRPGIAVPQVIHQVAEEIGADLIVIGAHGHSGIVRFMLGSAVQAVLCVSDCDVLVVPPPAQRLYD
jgi:nucleotide-binding universal stress UspA family protein